VLEEVGTVVDTEGEYAWIETDRQSACGACASRQGCAGGSMASVFGRRPVRIRSRNAIGARPGDRVLVAVNEAALSEGSLTAYAVPLLGLLVGAGLGQLLAIRLALAQPDGAALILGALGLAVGLAGGRRLGVWLGRDGRFEPILKRRLSGGAIRTD
jgi:sigma-E factor negative regulatory protein RseC